MPAVISMETGLNLSRTPRRCGFFQAVKQSKVATANLCAPFFPVALYTRYATGVSGVAAHVLRVLLARAKSKIVRAVVASHAVFVVHFVRPFAVAQRHQNPMSFDWTVKKCSPKISVWIKVCERGLSSPATIPNPALMLRSFSTILKHVRRSLAPKQKASVQVEIKVFPQFCGRANLTHEYRSLPVPSQHMQGGRV